LPQIHQRRPRRRRQRNEEEEEELLYLFSLDKKKDIYVEKFFMAILVSHTVHSLLSNLSPISQLINNDKKSI
jgi:hypothetical protein